MLECTRLLGSPLRTVEKSHEAGIPCACNAPDIVQGTEFVSLIRAASFLYWLGKFLVISPFSAL